MKERSRLRNIWTIATIVLAFAAIVKELRLPSEERTWHGKLAGFIPYDFRIPTISRIRDTYWSPEGPLISNRVFGVGWTLNAGALKNLIRP